MCVKRVPFLRNVNADITPVRDTVFLETYMRH